MRTAFRRVLLVLPMLAASSGVAEAQRGKRPTMPSTPPADVPHRPIAQILRIAAPDLSIGKEVEDGPYIFGLLGGVAAARDGTIYVNDWTENTIRAFDSGGRHIGSFGRRGRGPGEFVNPLMLVHDGDSTLYASQKPFGITELHAIGGEMRFRRTFATGIDANKLCMLGDSLLAVGWMDGKLLHLFGGDGKFARSFGEGWARDTFPAVREVMNRTQAHVHCDPTNDRVVLAQLSGPLVRAYGLDGRLKWETRLPDYRYMLTLADGKAYSLVYGGDGTALLADIGNDRLLLQVVRVDMTRSRATSRGPGGRLTAPTTGVRTFVLSASTGALLSVSTDAPALTSLSNGVAFEVVTDPFPVVRRRLVIGRS